MQFYRISQLKYEAFLIVSDVHLVYMWLMTVLHVLTVREIAIIVTVCQNDGQRSDSEIQILPSLLKKKNQSKMENIWLTRPLAHTYLPVETTGQTVRVHEF